MNFPDELLADVNLPCAVRLQDALEQAPMVPLVRLGYLRAEGIAVETIYRLRGNPALPPRTVYETPQAAARAAAEYLCVAFTWARDGEFSWTRLYGELRRLSTRRVPEFAA